MIDFACKRFDIEEVIRCSLGLTKADLKIMKSLAGETKEYKSSEISSLANFELSTVQRSLKKLHEKNIVTRGQLNLSNGYIYLYKIKPKKELKEIVMKNVRNWTSRVEHELDRW